MIEIPKVGIDIDGKVYEIRKISFGTQRKLTELSTQVKKLKQGLIKKHGSEEKIPQEDYLEVASVNFKVLDILGALFIKPDEAQVLDLLTEDNLTDLITALR